MKEQNERPGLLDKITRFCLENSLVVILGLSLIIGWGIIVAPFDWHLVGLYRDPVPVDAIPDIGENQQIVFTEWMGRSPQDIEDQITYPLTTLLLGMPGVKTIRSNSMFGFSTIYVIFDDDVDFYWSRTRILEKLNSLPANALPPGVSPALGPDATALGQVFWYTLEGRDADGNPAGGWELQELRSIQDWHVRYALMSAEGVSEVASVGGFVQEYQIDIDPDAMRAYRVTLNELIEAVKMSNLDVGARSIEVNKVEYVIRGIGFVKTVADIENAVIKANRNTPVFIKNIARVSRGPALRRGALDKGGAEVVGGVVVVRYGENPLKVIQNIKQKIAEISAGLPQKKLPDGRVNQVKLIPFYDRTELIRETLGTLNTALSYEILVTIIVVLMLMMHFRSSILISGLLPIAILMVFIAMKLFHVDANIVALSGIAIAIGTMVDLGIIISENILRRLNEAEPGESTLEVIYRATREVGGAAFTAVATTVVSFLPVFAMQAAEGKLFKPLAFTKTFALIASLIVALTIIPPFARMLFAGGKKNHKRPVWMIAGLIASGIIIGFFFTWWIGALLIVISVYHLVVPYVHPKHQDKLPRLTNSLAILLAIIILSVNWLPLGPQKGSILNFLFVGGIIGSFMLFFIFFKKHYARILTWALNHKIKFLLIPGIILILGLLIWLGFESFFGWLPNPIKRFSPVSFVAHQFPGLGKEFMPALDEGSYLYMPTTMPHASIGEVLDVLQKQDRAISAIPEVAQAVGKLGRVDSPLDPAPISMIETIINYHPEFLSDENGKRLTFRHAPDSTDYFRAVDGTPLPAVDGQPYLVQGAFIRDKENRLIPETGGHPFRLWRSALLPELNVGRAPWQGIQKSIDIWDEIVSAAEIPGTTSAPMLQPIATRIVMLQSGMRAPMGIKVKGPDLASIEKVGLELEQFLKEIPAVEAATVFADRIVGKPYLEIEIDRLAIARYGIKLNQVQEVIETAIGGKQITTTVEGRERYPIRVRYARELRDNIEALDRIFVPSATGAQIPLAQLAKIKYIRGPQMIKSEDTFLTGYVIFDKKPGYAEVDVVMQAKAYLQHQLDTGQFKLPAGVSFSFSGSYENQVRAQKRLSVILPLALIIIFMILYFQFRSVSVTSLVFSGIAIAWAGGFIMLWLYNQSWFLDFSVLDVDLRELFNIRPYNLSVAVWVGFLALFGIATDDGVVIATYLKQSFERHTPQTIAEIRHATLEAGLRRIRPALMTTATTILALIPVLTATGRGADIMVPMAIPSFGGMIFEVITMLVVPVLYATVKEAKISRNAAV
ncbi:efflux RND transporter permease subunit [candidate division KSB1 bacterium]|nr:efflux RND transporter permease subunit [candidate division KSB1 bacterium]